MFWEWPTEKVAHTHQAKHFGLRDQRWEEEQSQKGVPLEVGFGNIAGTEATKAPGVRWEIN